MIKTKKELIDHCLLQVGKVNKYTFEHYILMYLLNDVSDEDFNVLTENFKIIYGDYIGR